MPNLATGDVRVPIVYLARGGPIDGSARQLIYLLQHLDRSRFDPLVLLDAAGGFRDALRGLDVVTRVTRMRPWRSLRGWPGRHFDAAAALRIAAVHRPQIVHCSDTWRTPYAAHVARRLGVPLVAHVRGPTRPRDLLKNHCLRASAIIGIAERYRPEIEAAGCSSARVSIVDDAVDTTHYRPEPAARAAVRAELGIDDRRVLIGMVGRVEPLKRVIEFVDAIGRLPHELPATFAIVGSTQRADYVAAVRDRIELLGLAHSVKLVGRRDDMPAVLSALDVLATFSGGSVMFEGMACGTPVLSVRADGRHSLHTEHDRTACCVTTDEPQRAADALHRLITDPPLRQRLGEAGRACVSERLSPATMAGRTEAIYESVLAASAMAR